MHLVSNFLVGKRDIAYVATLSASSGRHTTVQFDVLGEGILAGGIPALRCTRTTWVFGAGKDRVDVFVTDLGVEPQEHEELLMRAKLVAEQEYLLSKPSARQGSLQQLLQGAR